MIKYPHKYSPGSALLLTVMIIAILTTTTLASIAVRFDQLAATDKIANASVAKSAADSALIRVKEKLATTGTNISPTIFDLDANNETTPIPTPFRPSPRKIVSTYQKVQTSLPRCLAVGVLIPWTNDGQYLGSNANGSNPAMMFYYANIVNDTPLGIVPGNNSLGDQRATTISGLTNMGHFYNPFAPRGSRQSDVSYWTIKLGGPGDQFLTRKGADGVSSIYKGMDFFYLQYLPRWQASGLFTTAAGTGTDRIDGAGLQTKFENTIKDNSFKIWIDASVSDAQLAQYGFGDLFVNNDTYRLQWLQPSLWNDTPETDLMTPYKANVDDATLSWTKRTQPLMALGANDDNWNTAIVKGAKSFSFIKLDAGQSAKKFCKPGSSPDCPPGATITGLIYGSLEGLRLNQSITLALLDKNLSPLALKSRGQDQGRLYNVKLTKIGPTSINNGVESIQITFQLSNSDYDTPMLVSPVRYPQWSDMDVISVLAPPQFSTNQSNKLVTINSDADGIDVTVDTNDSNCVPAAGVLTVCPAVGDLVSLTKAGNVPVWGKVTAINMISTSQTTSSLSSFVLDKLHKSPLPTREMASTYFNVDGNTPRIAYYGGAINMNDYDGGYASESGQLWIYNPEAADNDPTGGWSYPNVNGTLPGPRAGASMVYDNSSGNNRLILIGGYYHQAVTYNPAIYDCELGQLACLYTNRPGMRIAKRVSNDIFAFNLAPNSWERLNYSGGWGKIIQGDPYTIRVTSTLADRSGLERWNLTAKNPANTDQTLNVDGSASTVQIFPSAAGIAMGDQIYLYGTKTDSSSFYAWAKINFVNHTADGTSDSVDLTVYGYQKGAGETFVTMKALAIQVLTRNNVTKTCTGVISNGYYSCQFASSDTSGYAVGDSVVLERYDATSLTSTLSGFISYIDRSTNSAYFVADETKATLRDFSDVSAGARKIPGESAAAFPSARYGATFAVSPTATDRASYWQGAAKNLNYNQRFADLWNVQFRNKSLFPGALSAVWSFQTTTNDKSSLSGSSYRFQVVKPSYLYQLSTTTVAANNPVIAMSPTQTDPKTGATITAWDNSQHWPLEISPTDAPKVVTGAWATLERRQNDGSRQTFHGIVDDMYASPPTGCAYATTKLCLRHNPSYPNDTGFSENSAGVKITMTPSFSTTDQVGGTFGVNLSSKVVTLQNVPSTNLGKVPGLGAMVMIWHDNGTWPADAYTFIVNDRAYANGIFTFSFDEMLASPQPLSYSTSQIGSFGGTDRIITLTDIQQNYYDTIGAPEWIKNTSNGTWMIRKSLKYSTGNMFYRPSTRRAGAIASYFDGQNSQLLLIGGTYGMYGTLWRETGSGNPATSQAAWGPRFVSAAGANDVPNLFGASLVVYKQGSSPIRAVYFGGKQKTDFSSADYGLTVGPYMQGRADGNTTLNDNSFFIANSGGTDAVGFAYTIENNKAASTSPWPANIDNSFSFQGGNRGTNSVCAYLGQRDCSSKELLSQLGTLGRLDRSDPNKPFKGSSYGKAPVINRLGSAFKKQDVSGDKPSLIMSTSTVSGIGLNDRWQQDGYQPYMTDTGLAYGRLASDFGSDKTAAFAAYASINDAGKSGAILATSVGVGTAIASNRGDNGSWYSYCAKSDTKVDIDGNYSCDSTKATRYLSWLPDAEDLLFVLNASQALSAIDTYKVVGYYGGVKHGYLVTSRSGSQPTVSEIVP